MTEHADGALGTPTDFGLDALAHRFGERKLRGPHVVLAAETGEGQSGAPEEGVQGQHPIDFLQIEEGLDEPVAEAVRMGVVSAVPHPALVNRAVPSELAHAGQDTPSRAATSTALLNPSSWKPKPQ